MRSTASLDIIIPARDEEAGLAACAAELRSVLSRLDLDWAAILIDDGSRDGTVAVWRRLMAEEPRFGLIRLAGCAGKEAALLAGMRHARADAVLPLDADLQDPPALIPAMVESWRRGSDQVVGIRSSRGDPWWRSLAARVHYALLRRLSRLDLPREAGDFRLLDRSVVDRLLAMPEVDRYTKGLYALAGGSIATIPYERPPRRSGRPAQRLDGLVTLSLDGITGFTDAPLRWLLPIGLFAALFGVAYLVYLLVVLGLGRPAPPGYPTIICLILVFGGIQVAALGLLGEYLARIYRESKRRPPFFVAECAPPRRPAP